ncbi:hypothetical protein [Bacteroides sp.]|jgi:hypothetical protein|uniref:hypothetical protein n=1 Tax=Bacteroides sp. TaxID=29523 RepID=UPI0025836B45|nr:hypothetical protein [Bacteroides sp.]
MNFREKLRKVLQLLDLSQKAADKQLASEDIAAIATRYQKEFQATLREDMDADSRQPMSQEEMNQLQALLAGIVPSTEKTEGTANSEESPVTQSEATPEGILELAKNVAKQNGELQKLVKTMTEQTAEDTAAAVVTTPTTMRINGPGTTAKYLFGIETPMFDMSKRWNKIAENPNYSSTDIEEGEEKAFFQEVSVFSKSLAKRYEYLNKNHLLDPVKLAAGEFSTDFAGVGDAKVGDQYVIRRQDALIAHVLKARDLTQFFPIRYGIQDHDLVFNTFFDEVSQGWQEGEVWKGGMKLENEMGHVDDAMIKMKFGPMKKLERMYIGYLNKEGSDPIKWSLIEYCIVNTLETAQVEQNKRRIRGIYATPEKGVPSHFLNASTGLIYTLIRYYHENKILLHDDVTYRSYTKENMVDAVKEFVADIIEKCTEDMDLDQHVIYLNNLHQTWWKEGCRARYGKDLDFTGPDSYLNVVPDTTLHIKWLPYLGQSCLMFLDIPGNIQFLEYIPGEMMAFKAKDDMEMVKCWSTWKEGTAAAFLGRRFKTHEELVENNYEWQQIFMNKPSVDVAVDATVIDAKKGFWQVTSENTKATAITDIKNAKAGIGYLIECGSKTNASTISKSGKFADITANYTPTKEGDYILVLLNKDGNFRELERCVGGIRTVNAVLQPNLPGVR